MQLPAVTPAQMWGTTGVVAVVDLALALFLTRRLRPPTDQGRGASALSPGILLGVATLVFAALFTWAFRTFWDSCYAFALPQLMRSVAPLIGLALGVLGWLFWLLARRAGRWTVPVFLLLGGLESVPGHLNAVYRFGLLERCPLLQQISPTSALVFGVFEFGFYWAMVLVVSLVIERTTGKTKPPATPGSEAGGRQEVGGDVLSHQAAPAVPSAR